MKQSLWLIFALSLVFAWASPIAELQTKFSQIEDPKQGKALITEYLPQMKTLEDHRVFQSIWSAVDKEAMAAHYNKLAEAYPDNREFQYLALRYRESSQQISESRILISRFPDFYWGYRILAVSLSEVLRDSADPAATLQNAADDLKLLQQGLALHPQDGYIILALFNMHEARAETAQARKYLLQLDDAQVLISNWSKINDFAVAHRDRDLLRAKLPAFVSYYISMGYVEPQDSLGVFYDQYLSYIGKSEDAEALQVLLKNHPELAQNAAVAISLTKAYSSLGNPEAAFKTLNYHVDNGNIDLNMLTFGDPFAALAEDPRWQALVTKAEQNWAAGKEARRAKALKERTSIPAKLWELEDATGKLVKMKDFSGQVIILDFWATWCGPCRMAMPALDQWMKDEMPKGVQVFSVNVMERDPQAAKDYFKENPFRMTLLMGNPDIQKDYQVEAIPQITVIDTKGNIAFTQVGFSPELEEKLSFWTEALRQE